MPSPPVIEWKDAENRLQALRDDKIYEIIQYDFDLHETRANGRRIDSYSTEDAAKVANRRRRLVVVSIVVAVVAVAWTANMTSIHI